MEKVRRMFLGGNTANGFYSFHNNIIGEDRKRLYILKGMPGGGKSSLMKEVANRALDKGYSIEYHHCPSDPSSIDGLLIKELKIALVDGTAPHIVDPVYPGLKDKLIDLGVFIDWNKLSINESKIIEAKSNNKISYERAFTYFKSAKNIKKLIEKNNRKGMDENKLNQEIIKLIEAIFSNNHKKEGLSQLRHMFSAANTPEGYVDFTHTILNNMSEIYYIKGEIGTGKSIILKILREIGQLNGYNMEVYYNPTIPEKIETLIIEELNICITSNKKAEEFFHEEINLNKYFDSTVINKEDYKIYNILMEEGVKNLGLAKANHEILEKSYRIAIDYSGVDQIKENILREIFNY